MEKTLNILNGCEREYEIVLTSEELAPFYNEAYQKAQPRIDLKGFRKGKVPLALVKKMYGKQIEADTDEEIVNKKFSDIVNEENLYVVGAPHLHDIIKNDAATKFIVHFEIFPDFELTEYRGLQINEPVHSVSDEEISNVLKNVQLEHAEYNDADEILDENYLVDIEMSNINFDTDEVDETAKPVERSVLIANPSIPVKLKTGLINKKLNDVFVLEDTTPDGTNVKTQFKVLGIQKAILAELTEDLVKKVTKNRFDNLDDYKEEIGYTLQEKWDAKSKQAMESHIVQKMLELNKDFPLPKSVLDNVIKDKFESLLKQYKLENVPNKDGMFEQMKPKLEEVASNELRWEMIRAQVIKKENITVEDYDIEPFVEDEHVRSGKSKEELKKQLLKNEYFINSILVKKAMDFLLDFAVTSEVSFDSEQLLDQFNDEIEELDYDEEFEDDDDDDDFDDDDDEFEDYEDDDDDFDDDDEIADEDDEEEDEEDIDFDDNK